MLAQQIINGLSLGGVYALFALGFTLVFVPLVVWYTSWAFYVMRGKVDPDQIANDEHAY